jgi:hypothetical protein
MQWPVLVPYLDLCDSLVKTMVFEPVQAVAVGLDSKF